MRNGATWRKQKDGFVTIESVIAMSFFLMFFFLVLGFYLFVHPQTAIGRDVHALATLAERQGGLTTNDVEAFRSRLVDTYPFIDASSVVVELTTETGIDAISGDLQEKGSYISRDTNDLMTLVVTTNSNSSLLHNMTRYFGAGEKLGRYGFSEVVYSERY